MMLGLSHFFYGLIYVPLGWLILCASVVCSPLIGILVFIARRTFMIMHRQREPLINDIDGIEPIEMEHNNAEVEINNV